MAHDPASDAVRLTFPAKAEYISLCRLALAGLTRLQPFDDETLADLKLAITEAASNSVRHAYREGAGVVEVLYQLEPGRLVVEVRDSGEGFEPPAARLPAEGDLSEGGLGIAIIRAVADELEIGTTAEGSRLRFTKRLAL